jgi:glycosyltransferase involved in cell wall biosynthesis
VTEPGARVSVIVATYNWKEALRVVLHALRAQRESPMEVIVADDGSRPDTGALVADEARTFPVPLLHVWHEDTGFRLGTIRNKAIARARGDYIVQLDGDIVVHPMFVRAHRRFARRGSYVQGSRAMVGKDATRATLEAGHLTVGPFSRDIWNRANGIYLPWLVPFVTGPTDPLRRTRGCHMAFWRDDLVRVNGYNEDIEGWGREDSEIAARLLNAGVRRRNFKFAAVAWHLWHQERGDEAVGKNHAIYEQVVRDRVQRCTRGLDRHLDGT